MSGKEAPSPPPDACRNCGFARQTHTEAKTDPQLKQSLAVCEVFEQAACGLESCAAPVAPPMEGMNYGYFGPWFCRPHCPSHLWEVGFATPPECVKCGVDRVEYLEALLKEKGIGYDDEWHGAKEEDDV